MLVCKVCIQRPFASLIRGTENRENNNLSITVDPAYSGARTPVMEKNSAAYAAETTKIINSLVATCQYGILSPEGLSRFAFRRTCPVECEAYSSGVSEKQKKNKISASSAPLR